MHTELTATPIWRDVVIVEGSDARSYLQTQLTQDVESIALGQSAWSFVLDNKSSIQSFVRVTRIGHDRVTLDTDPGFGHVVRERLDGMLFRTDARFSEATWPGIAWRGPQAMIRRQDAPIVASVPLVGIEALDVIGPTVSLPPTVDPADDEVLERSRVRGGWPSMGHELGPGITPAMTGLVGITVSFDKGCYTGQELVARTYHRGAAPPKRLVSIETSSASLSRGQRVTVDGDDVGEVTSTIGTDALGYLMRKIETPCEVMIDGVAAHVRDARQDVSVTSG